MRTVQDVYTTRMYPNQSQEARLLDMKDACYAAYCMTFDGLVDGKYVITPETIYDVIDNQIKPDWIDQRPAKICSMTMIRYVIRMACNNWLDDIEFKDKEFLRGYWKQKHINNVYIPHSGVKAKDSVQIERIGRVKIDPVDIPTRIHLVIARQTDKGWIADIYAAEAGQ